jgi:hypothetical protein
MAFDVLHHPAAMPRIPAVTRILSQFERPQLEGFISVAISLLDALDGDPDEEANGDELDGSSAEEDIPTISGDGMFNGPGCPIADAGECNADPERAAWMERVDQTLPPLPDPISASYRNAEDAEDEHDREGVWHG